MRQAYEGTDSDAAQEFWNTVSVPGTPDNLNQSLEYAGRVADDLEFPELLTLDALHRCEIVRRTFPRGEPDAGQ